jgi:hypothetical protein
MTAPKKLPARVRRIVERCRGGGGQTLCITYRPREIGPPVCWFEPSGRTVAHLSVMEAIASGLLVSGGDGLFGDETAQTWRAAERED